MIKKLSAITILRTNNYLTLWKECQTIYLPAMTGSKRILWNILGWIRRLVYKFSKVNLSKKGIKNFSTSSSYQINWKKRSWQKALLKNWRPISLLNVDLKIISKALATRLKTVLPSITSLEQTAYIEKRFLGENGRLISDIPWSYSTKLSGYSTCNKNLKIKSYLATMKRL